MELSFSELRTKEVVNTQDGRKLGKVCDIVLCYPENRWIGIVAPNGRMFGMKKNGLFIDMKNIIKIGEDVILVNVGMPRKGGKRGNNRGGGNACPPNGAQPCPPPSRPQPSPYNSYGGEQGGDPYGGGYDQRRIYEEYE